MPSKYTLSNKAEKEIIKILEYSYRNFGPDQAFKYKIGMEDCLQLLGDNPRMGRECNDIQQGYFRYEYKSHIIFYAQRSGYIFIAVIIHHKMDIKNMLNTGKA